VAGSNWFERTFGDIVAEGRYQLLAAQFGRNFEPHPSRNQAQERAEPVPGERDIHGNERGIDR